MLKNTKTKKVVSALIAVAFVVTMLGSIAHADTVTTSTSTTTTSTVAAPYVFTRNLTIGSTGADVIALQTMLVARGFLVMPAGVAMGYFGNLTQAALGAFQASVGISPTAGYFGPKTMAYLAAHPELFGGSTTPAPCPAGYTCNPVPGTGVTCPAGYTCTPAGGTTTSSNGEGTLTVSQGAPGGNSNIQTNVDVPVYGLQLRAQLGDIRVDRMDLDVQDTINSSPTSQENPGNFINNVKVWDGTTVLMNRSVSSADFVTGTSSTDYYLRLSGINFMVPNGTIKNLVVSFSTAGSIDTSRTLVIRGFGGTSLLYYTGNNNTANYVDISGISTTQMFQKPGNSTVVVGVDQSNPLAMTNYVDINNGAQLIPLLAFNTNTTQGVSNVTQVTAALTYTGTAPTGLHLFQGSTELGYRAVSGASPVTVVFDNLFTANTSGGNVYSIKADYPSTASNGSTASVTASNVVYKNSNGNTQTASGTATGNTQRFYHATPQLAFLSAPASVNNGTNGTTVNASVTFNFTAQPYPGTAAQYLANGSDFIIVATGGPAGTSTTVTSKSLVFNNITPTNGTLAANQQYNISLSGTVAGLPAGIYVFYLTSASSTVKDAAGSNVQITQTWGFDNWHSQPITVS